MPDPVTHALDEGRRDEAAEMAANVAIDQFEAAALSAERYDDISKQLQARLTS